MRAPERKSKGLGARGAAPSLRGRQKPVRLELVDSRIFVDFGRPRKCRSIITVARHWSLSSFESVSVIA